VALLTVLAALAGLSSGAGASRGSDPATSIVLDYSIAGIALGTSRAVVEHRLGRGALVTTHLEGSGGEPRVRVETRSYAGLLITYVRPKDVTATHGKVATLDTRSSRYRTVGGLGVGSRWTVVLSLKGTISSLGACTAQTSECQHGGSPANRARLTIFFQGAGQRVARIVITFGH